MTPAGRPIHREIAPANVVVMQPIRHLLWYGERLTAARLGIPFEDVHDRAPSMPPTAFGLAVTKRFAGALGPLPH